MKIVFATNFYNHHQKPFADALYSMIGDGYHFIETEKITEERLNMGWGSEAKPGYVLQSYADEASLDRCRDIINDADVVILGSAPYSLLEPRLKKGKLTFIYTERMYKKGVPILKLPVHFLRAIKKYIRYKNFYVLCASAYTALDFSRTFSFIGKTYKWGYFTELKKYDDIDGIIDSKKPASILWVARMIDLKHPEKAIEVAKRLKAEGYRFTLDMIGNGALEEKIQEMLVSENLTDCVNMLGVMKPMEVREMMEKSEIFLFTSDRNEGWGAVLNESMNSACAVVASHSIGSVPFLLENGENGYIYKDDDTDDLYRKVKDLLDDAEKRKRISKKAYLTMADQWNAENAAKRFVELSAVMLNGEYRPFPYESGVLSKAKILKDKWFKG